jgi:integrase
MIQTSSSGRALSSGSLKRVQRGNGPPRWVLSWTDAKGSRHRQALSTDRRVAEQMRTEIIRQRDMERAGLGAVDGQSMELAMLRDQYVTDLGARVGTKQLRSVTDALARVLAALEAKRVRDLRVADLMRYQRERLAQGVSNRTVNIDTGALRAMLTWALTAQVIAENPIKGLKPLPTTERHQRRVRRALSDDEIERFLAAAEADDADCAARASAARTIHVHGRGGKYAVRRRPERVPQAPLWRAFLETAARWGELTQVTWADLDPERRALHLRATTTKNGRSRAIPLRAELVQQLLALRPLHQRVRLRVVQPSDRIFLSPDGADWASYTTNARRLLRRVLDRAGIDRLDCQGRVVDIHALRHTAGSRLGRRGVPLVVTQRLMGHSDPKLTARVYTHLELEDLRGAVEAMEPRPAGRVWEAQSNDPIAAR